MERQEKTKAPAINPLLAGFICVVIVGFLSLLGVALVIQSRIESAPLQAEKPVENSAPIGPKRSGRESLDIFLATLKEAKVDSKLVKNVSADGTDLTITVTNLWHRFPYQERLQAAQNFARTWEQCTGDRSGSTISIEDFNGNRVGGEGITGVWVQK
jgi:hypothetical protein